jgi:hypothetical protein
LSREQKIYLNDFVNELTNQSPPEIQKNQGNTSSHLSIQSLISLLFSPEISSCPLSISLKIEIQKEFDNFKAIEA